MPDQMLVYRAAAFWARAYAPEISMGFLTKEEIEDAVIIDESPAVTPPSTDNEPEPPVDNLPDEQTDGTVMPDEANKTPYRAPENHQGAAPAPKPQDKVAEAISRQGTSKTAKELHEQYMQKKQDEQQQEDAPSNVDTEVDTETGEILNNSDNKEQ